MKERLDVLLVSRGLAPSREKAKTMEETVNIPLLLYWVKRGRRSESPAG